MVSKIGLFAVLAFLITCGVSNVAQARTRYTPGSMKVCVYYDSVPQQPNYKLGNVYSVMLQNLLGHFREVSVKEAPAASYVSGELSNCDRAIYIGSYYEAPLSEAFLKDVSVYDRPFFWISYNIWQLQNFVSAEKFEERFGFRFLRLEGYNPIPTPESVARMETPSFYRYMHYKGEVFEKFVRFDFVGKGFVASPELAIVANKGAVVVSEAEHSLTKLRTPYVLRKKNFFYIADVPFSFIHELDRYLIMSDVLFDFLDLPPRMKKKVAFVRIEDLHPAMRAEYVNRVVEVLRSRNIPFGMTIIPRFVDIYGLWDGNRHDREITHAPAFVKAIKQAIKARGRIFFHGYTHQAGHNVVCDSGASGDDFEFWDDCTNAPLPWDSESYVYSRINSGLELFRAAKLPLHGWVPPHYQASPLAYRIFGKTFKTTMQRVRYTPDGINPADKIHWAGQFFPYVIEKDYYGQYVLPENLGNIRHAKGDPKDFNTQTAESVIEAAKKNLVIRDAWASFFYHPFLIDDPKVTLTTLEVIVDAISKMGYEWADLKDYAEEF